MVWRPKTRHKIRLGVLDFLDGMGWDKVTDDWAASTMCFLLTKPQASKVHKNIQKLTRLCTPHRCYKGCRYATSDEWGPYCCDGSPLASSCGCPRNLEGEGIFQIFEKKKISKPSHLQNEPLFASKSMWGQLLKVPLNSIYREWNSTYAMRWLWPARFLWRQLLMRSRNNRRVDGKF